MRLAFLWGFLIIFSTFVAATEPELRRFEFDDSKMGVPVRIVLYASDDDLARRGADAVYRRFDELNSIMSDYDPESEIIRLCRNGGEHNETLAVSPDLRAVLVAARHFCEISDGAFDITVSPVVKLWRRSRTFKTVPPAERLRLAKDLVGNDRWEISDDGVRILKNGVRFDLGGIAKGFALDEGLKTLRELGIDVALIDAGGDVRVGNAPPGKDGWTIGVASLAKDAKPAFYLSLSDAAIATSGDTFQFLEIDGVRYSHIIDPRTAEPLTRRSVVSVVAPDATTADALASASSILEPERSLELANSLENVEVLIYRAKKETDDRSESGCSENDCFKNDRSQGDDRLENGENLNRLNRPENDGDSTGEFEVFSTDFFKKYWDDRAEGDE